MDIPIETPFSGILAVNGAMSIKQTTGCVVHPNCNTANYSFQTIIGSIVIMGLGLELHVSRLKSIASLCTIFFSLIPKQVDAASGLRTD